MAIDRTCDFRESAGLTGFRGTRGGDLLGQNGLGV